MADPQPNVLNLASLIIPVSFIHFDLQAHDISTPGAPNGQCLHSFCFYRAYLHFRMLEVIEDFFWICHDEIISINEKQIYELKSFRFNERTTQSSSDRSSLYTFPISGWALSYRHHPGWIRSLYQYLPVVNLPRLNLSDEMPDHHLIPKPPVHIRRLQWSREVHADPDEIKMSFDWRSSSGLLHLPHA